MEPGGSLAGDIYTPSDMAEGERLPGVLMYHAVTEKASAEYMTLPGGHYDMYHGDNLEAGCARDHRRVSANRISRL